MSVNASTDVCATTKSGPVDHQVDCVCTREAIILTHSGHLHVDCVCVSEKPCMYTTFGNNK